MNRSTLSRKECINVIMRNCLRIKSLAVLMLEGMQVCILYYTNVYNLHVTYMQYTV